jgi:hypothetical protein
MPSLSPSAGSVIFICASWDIFKTPITISIQLGLQASLLYEIGKSQVRDESHPNGMAEFLSKERKVSLGVKRKTNDECCPTR